MPVTSVITSETAIQISAQEMPAMNQSATNERVRHSRSSALPMTSTQEQFQTSDQPLSSTNRYVTSCQMRP